MTSNNNTSRRITTYGISALLVIVAAFLVIYFFFPNLLRPPATPGDATLGAPTDYTGVFAVFARAKERAEGGLDYDEFLLVDDEWLDFSANEATEEGVQDGDIVKTDGSYIYALNGETLSVLETNEDGTTKAVARISATDGDGVPTSVQTEDGTTLPVANPYLALYIVGERLIALKSPILDLPEDEIPPAPEEDLEFVDEDEIMDDEEGLAEDDTITPDATSEEDFSDVDLADDEVYYDEEEMSDGTMPDALAVPSRTFVEVFDIARPEAPTKISTYEVSGSTISSRMVDSILYLVCDYAVFDYEAISVDQPETFVPFVSVPDGTTLVQPDNIRISSDISLRSTVYTHVVSIDTAGDTALVSQASLLGGSDLLYGSKSNLYLISSIDTISEKLDGNITTDSTIITRLSLEGGIINFAQSTQIPGTIASQAFINEANGDLRVISTFNEYNESAVGGLVGENYNFDSRVYIMDQEMRVIGELTGLVRDNDLSSCRFIDSFVYINTYESASSYFGVDLSDPTQPTLQSNIGITALPEQLLPWSDGLLLGFGMEGNDEGDEGFLKLSMLDASKPAALREQHATVLEDYYSSTAVFERRALTINREKSLIGFPADESYLVYSYNPDTGFAKAGEFEGSGEDNYESSLRALFMGDTLYLVTLGLEETSAVAAQKF